MGLLGKPTILGNPHLDFTLFPPQDIWIPPFLDDEKK